MIVRHRNRRASPGTVTPNERRCRGEHGDSLVSILMLMPVLVMFLELIVVGGRIATTRADVESAAREAARDASVSQSLESASNVVSDTVERTLGDQGFRCESVNHYFGFETYFDPDGRVEVVVECTVNLSDLGFLPTPGSHTVSARATEPIDQYRVVE